MLVPVHMMIDKGDSRVWSTSESPDHAFLSQRLWLMLFGPRRLQSNGWGPFYALLVSQLATVDWIGEGSLELFYRWCEVECCLIGDATCEGDSWFISINGTDWEKGHGNQYMHNSPRP